MGGVEGGVKREGKEGGKGVGNEEIGEVGGRNGRSEWETREKKSSWEREDEGWRKGRVEQEEGKRDKESGNQRERGCHAFPQHSFSPIQRAVKRQ